MTSSVLVFVSYSEAARANRYFSGGAYYAIGRSTIIKIKTDRGCGYGIKAFFRDINAARREAESLGLHCIGVK
ncbi:hypothetical protein FACS1894133_2970 [Clostridia bacterium]|nr:hypothetical protein FACS1894133_2970 [Clostridia bacterium]